MSVLLFIPVFALTHARQSKANDLDKIPAEDVSCEHKANFQHMLDSDSLVDFLRRVFEEAEQQQMRACGLPTTHGEQRFVRYTGTAADVYAFVC